MIRQIRLTLVLAFGAIALILTGCDSNSIVNTETTSSEQTTGSAVASKYGRSDGTVVIPFKSHFMTSGQTVPPGYRESCGDRPFPPYAQIIQAGSGQATHVGEFTAYGIFCMDITAFMNDGMLTAGESAPYDNGWFVITAANGDELWITAEGEVLPSDDPEYSGAFFDAFEFAGGTGRFEGATGGGTMASYIKDAPNRVSHEWDGELILPKGN